MKFSHEKPVRSRLRENVKFISLRRHSIACPKGRKWAQDFVVYEVIPRLRYRRFWR